MRSTARRSSQPPPLRRDTIPEPRPAGLRLPALPPPPKAVTSGTLRESAPPKPTSEPPRPRSRTIPTANAGKRRETSNVTAMRGDAVTAVRVSIEALSKRAGTYVVRVLGPGELPAAGGCEAFLVPTDPNVDLRRGR